MPLLEPADSNNIVELYKGEGEAPKLIEALERLPGVKFSMCTNVSFSSKKLDSPFIVFLRIKNLYSLSIIARAFDRRYSGTHSAYKVLIETADAESPNGAWPTFSMMISSNDLYKSEEQYNEDMLELAKNIVYWQNENFDEHFFKGKYNITL